MLMQIGQFGAMVLSYKLLWRPLSKKNEEKKRAKSEKKGDQQ